MDKALLLRGKGDGTFGSPQVVHETDQLYDAVAMDLNGDTKIDLLLQGGGPALMFLPGRGDGTFGVAVLSPRPESFRITIAELTGDGFDDVALLGSIESTNDVLIIMAGNGQGSFVETQRFTLPAEAQATAAADLDVDGSSDLVISYFESPAIDLLFGRGDGTFEPPVSKQSGSFGYSLTIADAEGDGDLDILVPHWDDDTVAVHRNLGGRTFTSAVYPLDIEPLGFSNNPSSAIVADVTGDGVLDLIVAAVNGQYVAKLRGYGDGTFAPASFKSALSLPGALRAADLDGDGRVDLFTGDRIRGSVVALRNKCGDVGTIGFSSQKPTIAPGESATFHVGVFGYGWPDSNFVIQPTGTVSIVEGNIVLATAPLISGAASVTIAGLSPGPHKLVARYSGDAQYEPAHSETVVQVVTSTNGRRRAARH